MTTTATTTTTTRDRDPDDRDPQGGADRRRRLHRHLRLLDPRQVRALDRRARQARLDPRCRQRRRRAAGCAVRDPHRPRRASSPPSPSTRSPAAQPASRARLRHHPGHRGGGDLRRRPRHHVRLHAAPRRRRHGRTPTPLRSSPPATPSSPCTTGRSCSAPGSWRRSTRSASASVHVPVAPAAPWIPTLGLIGAPLLLVSFTATLFGVWEQISGPAALLTLPIAVWEFSVRRLHDRQGLQGVADHRCGRRPASRVRRRVERVIVLGCA